MIQVSDKNNVIITANTESELVEDASRAALLVHTIAKKMDVADWKLAMSFLRTLHAMTNAMAEEIAGREYSKQDEAQQAKIDELRKKKFGENWKEELANIKEEKSNGHTEQQCTASGDSTDTGKFDSSRSNENPGTSKA